MDKSSEGPPCSCLLGVRFNTGDARQVDRESGICPSGLPVSLLASSEFAAGIEPSGPHGEIVLKGLVGDGVSGCGVRCRSSWHVVGCSSCPTSLQVGCES